MKIRTLALTALALSAATTFAVASPSETQPLNLAEVFEGVAPHYDVDVRLPQCAIARLKVDAATLQTAWRKSRDPRYVVVFWYPAQSDPKGLD